MKNYETKQFCFRVPRRLSQGWVTNPEAVLESFERDGSRPLFKFSYQPETGEFLCAAYPVQHCEMIEEYGAKEFDDYVRGIYFRDIKTVYLRGHVRKDWLEKTRGMLWKNGVPDSVRIVWGPGAAKELKGELVGL